MNSEVPSGAAGSALPFAPAERYRQRMRHRFGAIPVRTSALVALSVLGLLLAGRLISGPSTVRARPPATTLASRAPSRKPCPIGRVAPPVRFPQLGFPVRLLPSGPARKTVVAWWDSHSTAWSFSWSFPLP